jgi:hypothetical protein
MIEEMKGRHLGDFEVVRERGRGAIGIAQKAVQTSLGEVGVAGVIEGISDSPAESDALVELADRE